MEKSCTTGVGPYALVTLMASTTSRPEVSPSLTVSLTDPAARRRSLRSVRIVASSPMRRTLRLRRAVTP